ncbi:MAG: hypothetical protein F4X54_09310 [Chloroflexi bacterium]|nr:hypothetical protein [Chloroflexota bacterium]
MANDKKQSPRRILPDLALFAVGSVAFVLGVLVFGTDSETWQAIGAMLIGLSAVTIAYACWLLLHPHTGWSNPAEFAKETGKAILIVLTLLGIGSVLQGVGALAGWDTLGAVGDTLAKLFGGS